MPSATGVEQFERRLVELGCPARRVREKVLELADHYEDLKLVALEEGLTKNEAETRAAALLGDPVGLAENIVAGLREASWCGRHPFISFCLIPQFGFVFLWPACVYALCGIGQALGWIFGRGYDFEKIASALSDDPEAFRSFAAPLNAGLDAVSFLILTVAFCLLARRSAVGLKWILATCAACALAGLFFISLIEPHNVTIFFGWRSPHWLNVGIPLAGALLAFVRQRKMENRLAPIPLRVKGGRKDGPVKSTFLRRLCITPTYWVMTALTALILIFVIEYQLAYARTESRKAELKNKIWPMERAATLAKLQAGQQTNTSGRETPINLKPWLNVALTASADGSTNAIKNNLASLPAGMHTFAGVPFDVEGRAQLSGRAAAKSGKRFPGTIRNIAIGRKCDNLHLLHGASNLRALHQQIARLVLHYKDGTHTKIGIVSGEHLLDWWGPIYNTDGGDGHNTSSPGTELAWAGSNPWIKRHAPEFSLRLYRSTFANPHPELEIASIDYASTLADAAPFLVGLTLEQSTNKNIK